MAFFFLGAGSFWSSETLYPPVPSLLKAKPGTAERYRQATRHQHRWQSWNWDPPLLTAVFPAVKYLFPEGNRGEGACLRI